MISTVKPHTLPFQTLGKKVLGVHEGVVGQLVTENEERLLRVALETKDSPKLLRPL
jgi:hypothetical protein